MASSSSVERKAAQHASLVFDAIAVTAANTLQAKAYKLELELRKKMGVISKETLIVAVPDPASAGYNFIHKEYLRSKRILILHSGGDSQRIPICSVRGKAFCSLPTVLSHDDSEVCAPIDFLLQKLTQICKSAPEGGVFVGSTDVLLMIPDANYTWYPDGVTGFAIPAPIDLGKNHGVYKINKNNEVECFLQKPSAEEMKAQGAVVSAPNGRDQSYILIDSGVVYFSASVTEAFLELSESSPLDSCTSAGVDRGLVPLRFELYTDLLLAMSRSLTKQAYMALPGAETERMKRARNILWKTFNPHSFRATVASNGRFAHLGTTSEYMELVTADDTDEQYAIWRKEYSLKMRARAMLNYESQNKEAIIVNSLLMGHGKAEKGVLVEHSLLSGNFHLERGSLCSGIRSLTGLHLLPGIVIQEQSLSVDAMADHARFVPLLQARNSSPKLHTLAAPAGPYGALAVGVENAETVALTQSFYAVVLFGVKDKIKEPFGSASATFLNRPWAKFFETHGIAPEEVWPQDLPTKERTLWTARLFPVMAHGQQSAPSEMTTWMQYPERPSVHTLRLWRSAVRASFADLIGIADPVAEFTWTRELSFQLDLVHIEDVLLNRLNHSILAIVNRWTDLPYKFALLDALDRIAASSSLDVAARTLCAIADVLYAFPQMHNYIRSGPARNHEWSKAFRLLTHSDKQTGLAEAVKELCDRRRNWLLEPDLVIRAVRHYDGASQVLIGRCVENISVNYTTQLAANIGKWVHATVPVRIDLAGGWSDTPPISYEHGGAVLNVAVRIDGECPIGASVRLIPEPLLIFRSGNSQAIPSLNLSVISPSVSRTNVRSQDDSDPDHPQTRAQLLTAEEDEVLVCRELEDLNDYANPLAVASLLKCVVLCMGLVSFDESKKGNLQQQLRATLNANSSRNNSTSTPAPLPPASSSPIAVITDASTVLAQGLEIRTWSTLPTGTGLGVSSILAAAIVGAVARAIGRQYDNQSLIHEVLLVEQMLTTGGGWQDQVGGLLPGFKLTTSAAQIPLKVIPRELPVTAAAIDKFNAHTLLLYTGSSRLARNLLQTVIRRWYHRGKEITEVVDGLVENANQMESAVVSGDIQEIGRRLGVYWAQKKIMATDAEPSHISTIIDKLKPHVHGVSLCGAGGGGFLIMITKQPNASAVINKALEDDLKPKGPCTLHRAAMCPKGLSVSVDF